MFAHRSSISNEIAGDGDIPHPCVGHARRMMVPTLDKQSSVMIERVQNHTPGAYLKVYPMTQYGFFRR